MKKIFLLLVAMISLPIMAQDEYPKYIDSQYGYTLNGVTRTQANTTMMRQIVAQECATHNGKLYVVAYRWYSSGWEGSPEGYGNDTIAQWDFNNHILLSADTARLNTDEYSNTLWSVSWQLHEVAANDTVKTLSFYYTGASVLKYSMETATSYTAYAGLPYNLNAVENPLHVDVTYSSDNTDVATVNPQNGWITVVGQGECNIIASTQGDPALGIEPTSASWLLTVNEGDYYRLFIISPTMREETWESNGWTYHWKGFDRIEVTEANCSDIYGDGKVSFDIETRTLTLNNYQRSYTEEEDGSMGWTDWLDYESGPLPLNVRVIGNCAILHNSAGFFAGWDINFIGDGEQNSRLTLLGRFPQISVTNKITVSGVQVHAVASTPHPLMMCNTLRIENDSYLEAHMDIEFGSDDEAREAGAMVALISEIDLAENITMLTKDVHIEATPDGNAFVDGNGKLAMRVEIGPKVEEVISGEVDFSAIELTDDPTGTELNGVLYTLGENDGVDITEGCLVINSTMTADQVSTIINNLTPGSAAFAEQYHGLTVLLPVGKGNINIEMQTIGEYQLAVQIGNNTPVLFTQSTKGVVQIPYDLNVATFAYIYAVAPSAAGAPAMRRINAEDSNGSVKLYALNLTDNTDAIDAISSHAQSNKLLQDGQLIIRKDGKTYNAQGIERK